MATPKPRRATYQDVLDAPDHVIAEIIDGELVVSPRPALRHASVASVLGEELGPPFHRGRGGPGGWLILDEPELHLGPDVLVPDLGGWRRARMATIPDAAYVELAPDWICEVLSPSTAKHDRTDKFMIYARSGVGHAWIVDPALRTLEVFRLEHERWTLLGTWSDDALVRAEPFEAIELELGVLWADFGPPAQ